MADQTYNGWTNYSTWLVKLWLDDDADTSNGGRGMADEALGQAEACEYFTSTERATLDLSARLKADYEEALEAVTPGATIWADLLGAALAEVNWHEIATHMVEGAAGAVAG